MKISRYIPNFITSLNLFFGTVAVIYGFQGLQLFAVYLILAASLCDFLDGFTARLLKAYSPMGKELDSLADMISFGLAPTVLLYYRYDLFIGHQISGGYDTIYMELLQFIPLLVTIASALRLAKFNTDSRQSENFIGMPTPANAIMICMFLHFSTFNPLFDPLLDTFWFIPLLSVVLSYLLISNIPMFSMKFKSLRWKGNQLRYIILATGFITFLLSFPLGIKWSASLLFTFILYALINTTLHIYSYISKICRTSHSK
jgi:CDP-diacylglycerol--serine O-phosphatidyltransferase